MGIEIVRHPVELAAFAGASFKAEAEATTLFHNDKVVAMWDSFSGACLEYDPHTGAYLVVSEEDPGS